MQGREGRSTLRTLATRRQPVGAPPASASHRKPSETFLAACPVFAAFLGADANGVTDDSALGNGVAWDALERGLAVGERHTEIEALVAGRDDPLISVGSTHGFDERTRH